MKAMLSKKEFVKYIDQIRKYTDMSSELYSGFGIDIIETKFPCMDTLIVELIGIMFNDVDDWIGWWCWETDFGEKKDYTTVYKPYSKEVYAELNTAEDLYDFLIENSGLEPKKDEGI